jgi:hypothetical protein
LKFSRATIRVAVILEEFIAIGGVEFLGAEIGGQLVCDGAHFQANKGPALTAEGAHIKGHISMRGLKKEEGLKLFQVDGGINLASAIIDGGLIIENANLEGGLVLIHISVGQEFRLRKLRKSLSYSDFRHMRCGVLNDDVDAWGDKNKLNGFVYGAFSDVVRQGDQQLHPVSTNAESRIKWLKRQMPRDEQESYRPQPWRHLQRTLRAMGHDAEAREVGIAHQEVRREYGVIGQPSAGAGYGARLYARTAGALHDLYGHLTGYGYKPLKLGAWMIGVWLFCAFIFWRAALGGMMGPTSPLVFQKTEYEACSPKHRTQVPNIFVKMDNENWYFCDPLPQDYTTFSPLIYSLDLILPLVDLYQDKDWAVQIPTPQDNVFAEYATAPSQYIVRFVVWFEILFGWVASLMLVAVISGMARNTRDDE